MVGQHQPVPLGSEPNQRKANERGIRQAYECQLENMSDDIIEIFEQLKIKRDSAVKAYHKARKAWLKWKPTEQQKESPPAPIYSGPSELDLRIAKQRVKTRQWQLKQRQQAVGKTKSRAARGDG
jgi:hypothetical protein